MSSNTLTDKTRAFVEQLFEKELSENFLYHDLDHTLSVVHYCDLLTEKYDIVGNDLLNLKLAAWLHDTGYTRVYQGHEYASKNIAREFLEAQDYPEADILQVLELIEATVPEKEPKNLLESIIKDADLSTLGNSDFEAYSQNLRKEWEVLCNEHYSDLEWYQNNIEFIKSHQFYSEHGKSMFEDQKKANLKRMKKLMKKEKKKIKKARKKKKKKSGSTKSAIASSRSAQMMFKTSLRNHIDLTNIADSKSSMMLSINTIVISITIPLLASVVQEQFFMVIPAAFLLITCVLSIIFATLATRPIKMTGLTDFEKIKTGNTNLFFFGNFYSLDIVSYRRGLEMVVADEKILENTIVNDLYYLGKALGDKYAKLRICYSIFMVGITTTVIVFAITFFISTRMG